MLPGRFLLPLLALCSVVAAVQPRPDRGLIRDQTRWEQLAESDEDLDSHRFLDSLSSAQEMSCPSKPQGGRSSCNGNTLAPPTQHQHTPCLSLSACILLPLQHRVWRAQD